MAIDPQQPLSAFDFTATSISGEQIELSKYHGNALLIVNVASKCGFTPQYSALEALYRRHRESGLVVLGFPCDQFGHQEPGDEQEIAAFCSTTYDVTFPMFAKVDVNGDNAHPLFAWLRGRRRGVLGGRIKWNFTKFLTNRDGTVVNRFAPNHKPEKVEPEVVAALNGRA